MQLLLSVDHSCVTHALTPMYSLAASYVPTPCGRHAQKCNNDLPNCEQTLYNVTADTKFLPSLLVRLGALFSFTKQFDVVSTMSLLLHWAP